MFTAREDKAADGSGSGGANPTFTLPGVVPAASAVVPGGLPSLISQIPAYAGLNNTLPMILPVPSLSAAPVLPVSLPGDVPSVQPQPLVRKKRGRPPKDPLKQQAQALHSPEGAKTDEGGYGADGPQGDASKKPRGRPKGSRNRICKTGPPLVPHVLMIDDEEDVLYKLKELSQAYNRSLVILASTGILSSATLMQIGAQGQGVGVVMEGQLTILSLSGAVLQNPHGEGEAVPRARRREPQMFVSASLAQPHGGVVGGNVAGPLVACGPVMVVIAHWDQEKTRAESGDMESWLSPEPQAPATADSLAAPTVTLGEAHPSLGRDEHTAAVAADPLPMSPVSLPFHSPSPSTNPVDIVEPTLATSSPAHISVVPPLPSPARDAETVQVRLREDEEGAMVGGGRTGSIP